MDSSYETYLKDGEKYYPGVPTNIEIHTGRNRAEVQFTKSADPSVVKYIIYWNNRLNSKEVTPKATNTIEKVIIPDLAEGYFNFEMIAVDNQGNKSLSSYAGGNVYGAKYEANLYPRITTITNSKDGLIVNYAAVDATTIATDLSYTTTANTAATRIMKTLSNVKDTLKDAKSTVDAIQLKTAYLPAKAIDTFYAMQTVNVNLAAGEYTYQGTVADYTTAAITAPATWNARWQYTGVARQLVLFSVDNNSITQRIMNGTSASTYGNFGVIVNFDQNYNVVSIINYYGQPHSTAVGGRSAILDPSGVNKFDPVTKVLKIKYWLDEIGTTSSQAPHRASMDNTFTLK
ncbi:DUF4998 domain-containing protein [Chitinophagaceae bacterium LB-8]|uniref:DUF4998 domain-containing protein n=1 Tax=Paraflavisolibacter caeni TaxID=2982496 RepID=A0A9X3BJ97_9BACT|nr:DUF4998 domain-containing protein [Paraflavisolibacter caeni]MCU7552532.1 DUF4998 domain-containing protein [Paraflavisolibacter caeni]